MTRPEPYRCRWRPASGAAWLSGAALALALAATPWAARAQNVPDPDAPRRLEETRSDIEQSREIIRKRSEEADRLARDEEKLRIRSIETVRQVQRREAALAHTEKRLRELHQEELRLMAELNDRHSALSSILAALQLMERNKPPALVVRPDDAVDAARTAMLLGSILPDLRTQADNLGQDLMALVSLRQGILDQREQLSRDRESLDAERLKLSQLVDQKKRLRLAARHAVTKEEKRLEELAKRARNLEQLIGGLREHEQAYPPMASLSGNQLVKRFAEAKGNLRLPVVAGSIVRRYGEKDNSGNISKGILLRTRPGAQVVAPFDCTISFAKPYRSYGQLLILSTSDGYHFVLAGMAKIYGVEGQKLLEGEPVGVMRASEQDVQVLDVARPDNGTGDALIANAGPELYFEIREKGQAINPLPWLAAARQQPTP